MNRVHNGIALNGSRHVPGFTLVELLLYVGLASFLLLAMSVFLAMLLQARVKHQTMAEVEQQGLQVMRIVTQAIRNADSVSAPLAGTGAVSLTLRTVSSTNVVFDLSGNAFRIAENGGAPVALTNGRVIVSGLSFQNLSPANTPGIVRIQFTITHQNLGGRFEYDYDKTFIDSAALR